MGNPHDNLSSGDDNLGFPFAGNGALIEFPPFQPDPCIHTYVGLAFYQSSAQSRPGTLCHIDNLRSDFIGESLSGQGGTLLNIWLLTILLALSLSLFTLFLKMGLNRKDCNRKCHWYILSSLFFLLLFLLLFYREMHRPYSETWYFIPAALILNLIQSILVLKERLSITKTTAYLLIISGIVFLYVHFPQMTWL